MSEARATYSFGGRALFVKLVHPLIVADAERIAADALWSSPFLFFERRVLPTRHRLFRVRPRNPFRDRKRFLRVPRDDGRREAPVHGEHNPVSIRSRRRYQVAAMLKAATLLSCACLASSAVAEESPRCAKFRKSAECCGQGHGDCAVDGGAVGRPRPDGRVAPHRRRGEVGRVFTEVQSLAVVDLAALRPRKRRRRHYRRSSPSPTPSEPSPSEPAPSQYPCTMAELGAGQGQILNPAVRKPCVRQH